MPGKRKLKPASERQHRWREKKYAAEIAAGTRKPKRNPNQKPRTSTQRWREWRNRERAKEQAAKYAASRERRSRSRAAPPIEPEFRTGDCRDALNDIAPESVALVLTDPPWGNASEPLYRWLADFAARVLVPGGSLVCFTGTTTWFRDASILAEHLQPRPLLFMPHTQERPMRGAFVRIGARPVLWFSKGPRRNQLMVPTVARSTSKDKSLHPWQQGDAVWQWIEPLADPGDLVLDPFYGSGEWGHICAAMGRRWIGCEPLIDLGDNVVEDDGSATIAGPSELVDRQARGPEPAVLG